MNISINHSSAGSITRKHIKPVYIAAACAVALAAAAVVTNSSWQTGSNSRSSGVASTTTATTTQPQQDASFVYYLVRTPQEAAQLNGVLSSEGASYGATESTKVLVENTTSRELISLATAEMTSLGSDLRAIEPEALDAVVAMPRAVSQVDAAVMAGVVSSERATWPFAATTDAQRVVSDADLMTGVISSERAAWAFSATDAAEAGR